MPEKVTISFDLTDASEVEMFNNYKDSLNLQVSNAALGRKMVKEWLDTWSQRKNAPMTRSARQAKKAQE